MKLLLAPSKTMAEAPQRGTTDPLFASDMHVLLDQLKTYSINDLQDMFKVSRAIAEENVKRFQSFNPVHKALDAYTGYMFKMIDTPSLTAAAIQYIETHLHILSGLYGLVRMTDTIGHYRLPMGVTLKSPLSRYWKPRLTAALKGEWIIDLLSQEYRDALDLSVLDVVTIDFIERTKTMDKRSAMTLKRLRGRMVRACALNGVATRNDLKALSIDGFKYDATESTDTVYAFIKHQA